jgi:hypothetical protein
MVNLEKVLNISDFDNCENCLEFLAELKWKDGYICRKCGHTNYCKGKTPFSRRCTKCKHEESSTAHTIFHRCKIPLMEAFDIISKICADPEISTYKLSKLKDRRQMTCWKFKKKIIDCIEKKGKLVLYEKSEG